MTDRAGRRIGASVRRVLIPAAALAAILALGGCYYGPYGYSGYYYGYPGYVYAPPVTGGVYIGGAYGYGYGYGRGYGRGYGWH